MLDAMQVNSLSMPFVSVFRCSTCTNGKRYKVSCLVACTFSRLQAWHVYSSRVSLSQKRSRHSCAHRARHIQEPIEQLKHLVPAMVGNACIAATSYPKSYMYHDVPAQCSLCILVMHVDSKPSHACVSWAKPS